MTGDLDREPQGGKDPAAYHGPDSHEVGFVKGELAPTTRTTAAGVTSDVLGQT